MKITFKKSLLTALGYLLLLTTYAQSKQTPIGIDGLTHAHVHGALQNFGKHNAAIQIVGIAEPNKDLARRMATQYGFSMNIVYDSVEEMIEKTKPEGVMAFNSIYQHLSTVKACAPKGIHVMVEKPLAVNMSHANEMVTLAKDHNIMLLTNYETTWYPSNQELYKMVENDNAIGELRKVVICDGHEGPKEIGCNQEFLDWLTDPVQNGGGAVVDFGCYGANLMTWLMKNERPLSVSATLNQIKPEIYPNVDDEATIVVKYPKAQAIIQGSWNWPFGRKDMEAYGTNGYIKALDGNRISYRLRDQKGETNTQLSSDFISFRDPFSYFSAAINKTIKVSPEDLSSLENNLIVIEILDAARESARIGKTVNFSF
ncbi:Gfo/Idh/MocA family oxidoreductase [Sphingobacterium alkalisoli]|uniref:Gfo/Idh/MocA family oxidoreductase n=1 Tax=Sphingobacterium alkalisoli TaxID=1874115 RepID=A0A4U0H268_9SPHI|nr:Gfo/Idh/MocA family oxidoreductase [Sphingobacterium alkalisoli]TJY65703.1 Gfo/Idh/MocA family oxidoreductase [Sphingobacterium alkalisoli]GGH18824.1 oxidoreductase [Sphingobacterium alkalisoli]